MLSRVALLSRRSVAIRPTSIFLRSFSAPPTEGPYRGTVKRFDSRKGFGFLLSADFEGDIFVHQSQVRRGGFRFLSQGEEVQFEVEVSERGRKAINVTGPDGEMLPAMTWTERRAQRKPREEGEERSHRMNIDMSAASASTATAPSPSA